MKVNYLIKNNEKKRQCVWEKSFFKVKRDKTLKYNTKNLKQIKTYIY